MSNVLAMGGYGIYVWPAYFITLSVFGFTLAQAWLERLSVKKNLRKTLLNES